MLRVLAVVVTVLVPGTGALAQPAAISPGSRVMLRLQQESSTAGIVIRSDHSTLLLSREIGDTLSISWDDVHVAWQRQPRSRAIGAAKGFAIGLLAGAAVGGVASIKYRGCDEDCFIGDNGVTLLFMGIYGVPAGVLGGIIGGVRRPRGHWVKIFP